MPKINTTKQKPVETLPMFMTATQASKISGIGENKLRELMKAGELEFVQIGNRCLTTEEALSNWYARSKVPKLTVKQSVSAQGV